MSFSSTCFFITPVSSARICRQGILPGYGEKIVATLSQQLQKDYRSTKIQYIGVSNKEDDFPGLKEIKDFSVLIEGERGK